MKRLWRCVSSFHPYYSSLLSKTRKEIKGKEKSWEPIILQLGNGAVTVLPDTMNTTVDGHESEFLLILCQPECIYIAALRLIAFGSRRQPGRLNKTPDFSLR